MFSAATRASCPSLARGLSTAAGTKIGFIGLGNMGGHMAANLIKAYPEMVVFDLQDDAVKKLEDLGASSASTPKDVASQADIVVTMLPSSPHVQEVYGGSDGILEGAKPNAFLIDSSTIDPNVSRQVNEAAAEKGLPMVDAPVSGGVKAAEAGTLTFLVGGTKPNFDKAESILQHMGQNIFHCGDAGMGQTAKLCNNLILAISMAGVSEAMNIGIQLGIDPSVLSKLISVSSGSCWSNNTYNPVPGVLEGVPSSNGYSGGFASALMRKDVGLALDAAKASSVPTPMGSRTLEIYDEIIKSGEGGKDFSYVFDFLQQQNKND